ncbi:sodium:calcium antiporter [Desulforudis sp. 1088]|uniref:sodium:calcium antiporter n=1 Tax=Desulforudis sp. 1031 TaxID=3416138 RepID=UPI003CEE8C3C
MGEVAVVYLSLVLAALVILAGAKFFTNGVEWLGTKLGLARGAVGSILAALGTALPETMIPVVAILLGGGGVGEEVGVGAILGAPFMLATMGFVVIGGTTILVNRERRAYVRPQPALARRDLGFFLGAYMLAVTAAFLPQEYRIYVVALLLGGYACFVACALTQGERCGTSDNLQPLAVAPRVLDPPLALVTGQVIVAFTMIVFGAKVFVESIGTLSYQFGIAPFVFALLVAPVATELPELTNSIIWIKERKDTLAVGNVTGAMVFQSSVVPSIGIAFTSWHLTPAACLSAVLALVSALLAYRWVGRRRCLNGWMMVAMGLSFYIVYAALVTAGYVH